jgi:hypothetical protein
VGSNATDATHVCVRRILAIPVSALLRGRYAFVKAPRLARFSFSSNSRHDTGHTSAPMIGPPIVPVKVRRDIAQTHFRSNDWEQILRLLECNTFEKPLKPKPSTVPGSRAVKVAEKAASVLNMRIRS